MADGAFWKSDSRFATLARYALMDRVKAAAKTMDALAERLEKSRDRSGRFSPQLMGRLARQVMQTKAGSLDALANAPVECILKVDMALEGGGGTDGARDWCEKITNMYRGWASRRGMQLSEHVVDGATYLAVSGFGAHRTLVEEAGLHVLDSDEDEGSTSRCVARVRVAPSPSGDLKGAQAARQIKSVIDLVPASQTVVRRYREGSSPLVRDARRGWRSGRLDAVLQGDFDLIGMLASEM
jgi:ATP-dependent Clp protease ATP-binding subunit ClpC